MERKNLADLIEAIQTINPDSRENIEAFTKTFFNAIINGLHKDRFVKVKGLGTFKLIDVSSRESVDVNTGQRIEISGHSKITFTPDQSIKDAVNKPFAHLQAVVINEGTDVSQMGLADGKAVEDIRLKLEAEESSEQPVESVSVSELEISDAGDTVEVPEQNDVVETPIPAVEPEEEDEGNNTDEAENSETEADSNSENAVEDVAELENEVEDNAEFEAYTSKREKYFWLWLALVAIVFLVIGYMAGNQDILSLREAQKGNTNVETIAPAKQNTVASAEQNQAAPAKAIPAKKDSGLAQGKSVEKEKTSIPHQPIMPVKPGDNFMIVGQKGEHILGKGENLTRLAKQIYGSKDCAKYIIRFNNISDPDLITIGSKIKLPDLQPVNSLKPEGKGIE